MQPSVADLYPPEYFANRDQTDKKRRASFMQEAEWMDAHGIDSTGTVCDVGCSTGEFLSTVGWTGTRFGMEVSEHARAIASKRGFLFRKNITNQTAFFDVVIFRGTIQHVDRPFAMIRESFKALKPGGHIVFLQTPNSDSLVYRLFGDLKPLEWQRNWYIPGEKSLKNALTNTGFEIVATRKAYWTSPYAQPGLDHLKFVAQFFRNSRPRFAFHGSMMDMIGRKPL